MASKIVEGVLGYHGPARGADYNVSTEQNILRGSVDLAFGRFGGKTPDIVAPFELKGADTRDLETPEHAATREVWEELRIRLNGTSFFASYENHHEGKRDSVYLFLAHSDATPEPSPLEIKECRFVPLASLPDQVSPATLRRLDDIARGAPMSEQW